MRPGDVGGSAGEARPRPVVHELVSCVAAPNLALSDADGQIRRSGVQGLFCADRRFVSRLLLRVDGAEPVARSVEPLDAASVLLTAVPRRLRDGTPDPTVVVERLRHVVGGGGFSETFTLRSMGRLAVTVRVELEIGCDFADLSAVNIGRTVADARAHEVRHGLHFAGADVAMTATTSPGPGDVDAARGLLGWTVDLPPGGCWSAEVSVEVSDDSSPPGFFGGGFLGGGRRDEPPWSSPCVEGDERLSALLTQSMLDLQGLLLADPLQPADMFLAAGSPWYLTLFGRDALWAARMLLPLGTDLALGTLRTLARRQGQGDDPQAQEQPGKILHEMRRAPLQVSADVRLPTVYYGSIDSTPLWILLLADARRWGVADDAVRELLPALEQALRWLIEDGDTDGDGFLEYIDSSGHGLANQGWKDSVDSIQWADGRLADPPIALCEVQAYAYEAAIAGAEVLDAFARPGGRALREWAARLRVRFRSAFWVSDADGAYPAVALDGAKQPVDSLTSNIAHLLGTGLLDRHEEALVARRLRSAVLASGFGLRTLSAGSARFNPLSYHGGSIWPHDTAIAISGLVRAGHPDTALALIDALLDAAPAFDYRLPELYGGDDRSRCPRPVPYPAACRPQAWSAASAVVMLSAVLGLQPGARVGTLQARALPGRVPRQMTVRGLRFAGQALSLRVDGNQIELVEGAPGVLA